jgi:hypothetical protein
MAIVTLAEGSQGVGTSETMTSYVCFLYCFFGFGSVFGTFTRAPLGI